MAIWQMSSPAHAERVSDSTPAMVAVREGGVATVRWLLSRGANVNAVDDHRGRTALHWAAVRGAGKVFVTYLLDQGADPTIRDRDGAKALDIAREKKRKAVESMLLERGRG